LPAAEVRVVQYEEAPRAVLQARECRWKFRGERY
jgi:hypothetical protein